MNLTTALVQMASVLDEARTVAQAVQAAREAYTDEELDAVLTAHPALDALFSACIDLEAAIER